jgi:hypothetical protein
MRKSSVSSSIPFVTRWFYGYFTGSGLMLDREE